VHNQVVGEVVLEGTGEAVVAVEFDEDRRGEVFELPACLVVTAGGDAADDQGVPEAAGGAVQCLDLGRGPGAQLDSQVVGVAGDGEAARSWWAAGQLEGDA
jgi:hypothetical protein